MARVELKIVLKLHHDWKINYRMDYALLLMEFTDGKILSMFEAAAQEVISVYHHHGIRDDEINWMTVYMEAARVMSKLAREVSNGEI